MSGSVFIPSSESDYVELARTTQGRLFRKHILNKGELIHPNTKKPIKIDDSFVDQLIDNFDNRVCDIVQVPLAGVKNEHTEDPNRNIGEVVGVEAQGNKVYALIDARDKAAADKLGKTLLGASAMMHLDYTDTRTGQKVGPALLHVCVTNRPYVVELDDYEELLAASVEDSEDAVMLTPAPPVEETSVMTLEEIIAALKADHNIDLNTLMEHERDHAAQLSNNQQLTNALANAGVLKLSNGEELSPDDIVGAVAELAQDKTELSNRIEALENDKAEAQVKALVASGHILPAQESAMLKLRLSNAELFLEMVPEQPIVNLSQESGTEPVRQNNQELDIDAEIARLTASAGEQGYVR